jgi:hypothetical protein
MWYGVYWMKASVLKVENYPEYVLFVYVTLSVGHVTCFTVKKASWLKVERREEFFGIYCK